MGIVYGDVTLGEYVAERREWSPTDERPMPLFDQDPTRLERLYWSLAMASEWAREKAKLISSSPGAITGELLLFVATPDGRTVAASSGLCGHAGALRLMVKTMGELEYDLDPGSGGINDGDVFSCNDPVYGSSQNNDIYTSVPVFHEEQLIGWATGSLHVVDAGSVISPMFGGISPTTFTDGMIIPPTRTGQNFQQSKAWELMLHRRTRAGVLNVLDDKMKLVGALLIRDRMLELVKEYGLEFFMQAQGELIERDRREIMELSRSWAVPSVSKHPRLFMVRQKDVLANAFPQAAQDFFLHVPVTVLFDPEGTVTHDYSGASSQRQCAFNCYEGGGNLATYVDFPLLAGQPSVSSGIFDVVRRRAESGSFMNPDRTDLGSVQGPVSGIDIGSSASHGYALARFARGFIEQAWSSEMLYSLVMWDGEFGNGVGFSGADWTVTSTMPLGVGAWRDAIPAMVGAGNPQPDMGEAEEHELLGPTMVYIARTLHPNLMAHGKYRGAVAYNMTYLVHHPGGRSSLFVEGTPRDMSPISMVGMCGGYPALPFYTLHLHDTNSRALIEQGVPLPRDVFEARDYLERGVITARKVQDTYDTSPAGWQMMDGDLVFTANEMSSSWGDPIDRDPERIREDVADGWITSEVAETVYATIVRETSPKTWELDVEGTQAARMAMRDRRRERSVPVRDWWQTEGERARRGAVPPEIADVYVDCLNRSDAFDVDFVGCWGEQARVPYQRGSNRSGSKPEPETAGGKQR